MIRGVLVDVEALMYGPTGAELLAEVMRSEELNVDAPAVAAALARLPVELTTGLERVPTEEAESEHYQLLLPPLLVALGQDRGRATGALFLKVLEAMYDYHAYFSLYPEALSVLQALKGRDVKVAVTGRWAPSLRRMVREFELEHLVAAVLSSAEAGLDWRDPLLLRQALKAAEIKPAEALYAGPALPGVTAAEAAGIRAVWVNRTGIPTAHEVLSVTDLRGLLLLAGRE